MTERTTTASNDEGSGRSNFRDVPGVTFDDQGRALIAHRPLQILFMYGGGLDVAVEGIALKFKHYLSGIPVAKLFDAVVPCSGAAILAVDFLRPKENGSDEPLFPDCTHGIDKMASSGPIIFPSQQHHNHYVTRSLRDAQYELVYGLLTALQNKADGFIPQAARWAKDFLNPYTLQQSPTAKLLGTVFRSAVGHFSGYPEGLPALTNAYGLSTTWAEQAQQGHEIRVGENNDRLESARIEKTNRVHFSTDVLERELRATYKVKMPGAMITERPLTLSDLTTVKTVIIPAITVNNAAAGEKPGVYFSRPVFYTRHFAGTSGISPHVDESYETMAHAATAVVRTCALPTIFKPAENGATAFIDPCSDFSALRGTQAVLQLYSPKQRFMTTSLDCGVRTEPKAVTARDLTRGYLASDLSAMNNVGSLAYNAMDDQSLRDHDRCVGTYHIRPDAPFKAPHLQDPKLVALLEGFAGTLGFTREELLTVRAPDDIDDASKADASPAMHKLRIAVGYQMVERYLPELVALTRDLVKTGPFSDTHDIAEVAAINQRINEAAPPASLAALRDNRTFYQGTAESPHNITMYRKEKPRADLRVVPEPALRLASGGGGAD